MVNDLGSIDDLELMPLGGGYMVRRERLMNELIAKGRKAGIVVLYAPDGFGKTSVLLQYTHEVKCDPTRGPVRIIEADRAIGREVFMQLEVVTEELKDKPHSLIAIDNVPNLDQHDTEDLIDRIRGLRAMGVGVFISCRPSNRHLIHGLGDSVKINAQMLKVHAYEYSAWASAFSISTSLDFYQLTQGVPELVSALQTGLYGQGDVAGLLAAGGGDAELGDGAVVLEIGLLCVVIGLENVGVCVFGRLGCAHGDGVLRHLIDEAERERHDRGHGKEHERELDDLAAAGFLFSLFSHLQQPPLLLSSQPLQRPSWP